MNRFRYWRDPIFLNVTATYALNRWLVRPLFPTPFLRGHLNDLLMIPAALPLALWVQRVTRLRTHDAAPSWTELFFHLAVWSVICEFIGPHWLHHGTADIWDVVAYAAGGIAACLWWRRSAQPISARTP